MSKGPPPPHPDREIVAVRTHEVAGHTHITAVQLANGTFQEAADVISAIEAHEAHYTMRRADLPLPMLVQVRTCPDCDEKEIYA